MKYVQPIVLVNNLKVGSLQVLKYQIHCLIFFDPGLLAGWIGNLRAHTDQSGARRQLTTHHQVVRFLREQLEPLVSQGVLSKVGAMVK